MGKEVLLQPDIVGRQEELDILRKALEEAIAGRGSTVLVSGEAGIGKTRLVSEAMSLARDAGTLLIGGWCLPESLEPLMPMKEALRNCGMEELVSSTPPPKVLSGYLLNDAGMLFARVERKKSDMDADIFAAMLKAVSNFVADSLRMMGRDSESGGFSSIVHSGYRILVQSKGRFSIAIVAEGEEDEFLIEEMRKILTEAERALEPNRIDMSKCHWAQGQLMKLVMSPKYNGEFVMEDPRLRQENMFDNILLGLQRASASRPLLLFLDDLQWADPSTLGLLHYLARNMRSNRMLILGTYRPEDVMPGPEGSPHILETALQNMSRESLFGTVELKRLGKMGTRELVKRALENAALAPELCERIHNETDGNPFFVLEVLRLLVEEGFIHGGEGEWSMGRPLEELHLPTKIYDVIQRRLNRLLKAQYDILECASVVGERFGSDVLGMSLEMNRISLLKHLNEIENTHMLIHSVDSKYRFDHCKIRDVLYGNINAELRSEYHRTLARSYERLFEGREKDMAAELAYHYFEAGDARAAGYLLVAADKAMGDYANEEAIRFYNLALGMVSEPVERGRINECLGDIYNTVGEYDRAIKVYEAAMSVFQEPVKRADLFRKMARAFERHSDYDRGIAAARSGLELLGDIAAPVRCELLAAMTWCLMRQGDYEKALELQQKSLEEARKLQDRMEISVAHHLMGIIWWYRGDFERALEHYEEALAIKKEIGDDRGKENTLNNIGVVYMETGRLNEALEYFREGLEYEEMVGDKNGMASTLDNIGNLLHSRGDAEKALDYHMRGLELNRMTGDKNGMAWSLSSLGYVYPDLGRVRDSIECFLESAGICKEIGDQHILVYNYYGLADTYSDMGQFEKGMEYVNMALELSRELGAKREEGASTYVLGTIHRDLGEFDLARKTFSEARKMLADVGDTSLQAMIDYDEGICLKMSGDIEGARELLAKSRAAFDNMGLGLWLKKADKALAEID